MKYIYYPDISKVAEAEKQDDPLLVLIAIDGSHVIIGPVDETVEHHILLTKAGFRYDDLNQYFRIVLDKDGADWTFVCPSNYKSITDKTRRIAAFYRDGFSAISHVLQEMGYLVGIDIPKRYRRHFDLLK